MSVIKIVGLGPGHRDYILPMVYQVIREAELLVGSKRSLEPFQTLLDEEPKGKEVFYYQDNLVAMVNRLKSQYEYKRIVVVVTGDPGFYSLLDYIKQHLDEAYIEVIPGISSFQYLFSRLKKSYKDYGLYSLHGRNLAIKEQLQKHQGIFLLTDKKNSPSVIAQSLVAEGYGNCEMVIGENLSYPEEKITQGKVHEFIDQSYSPLCVVIIENKVGD